MKNSQIYSKFMAEVKTIYFYILLFKAKVEI